MTSRVFRSLRPRPRRVTGQAARRLRRDLGDTARAVHRQRLSQRIRASGRERNGGGCRKRGGVEVALRAASRGGGVHRRPSLPVPVPVPVPASRQRLGAHLFAGRVTNPAGRSRATARPRSQSGLLFRLAVLLSHDERHPVAHGSELGHAQRLAAASEVDVASLRRSIERLRGEIEHALPRVA